MRFRYKLLAGLAVLILLWCAGVIQDYFDPHSIAHESMQVQLKLFGVAMYEYHAATSLPAKSYIWRQSATTLTLLWPQNLKPDPKDNGSILLAYTDKGLFNNLGRVWVCWGDLRTEHLPESKLRARLRQ